MIPSLARATANLILHATQEVINNTLTVRLAITTDLQCFRSQMYQSDRASPARADVDIAGLVGHHGEFCNHLNHMVAVEHCITLRETQLDLD